MEKDDFINWIRFTDTRTGKISGGFAWSEVAWQRNTNRGYTHVQDLAAVFFNAYSYIEGKFKLFYEKTQEIPYSTLNEEIFEFRKHFPKHGRTEGVNYYDDLIELLIQQYTPMKNKTPSPKEQKPKFFPEYLHMPNWDEEDNVKAAEFLRDTFKGEIGKTIAHMIIALKGINAISFENRNDLYRSIEEYFGESIGTPSGINKYMVDKAEDDDCKLVTSKILKEYLFRK